MIWQQVFWLYLAVGCFFAAIWEFVRIQDPPEERGPWAVTILIWVLWFPLILLFILFAILVFISDLIDG